MGVFVMVVVVVFVTVVVLVTVVVSVFAEHPMALNIINADNKMEERIFAIFLILIPPIKTGFMMSVNVYFQGIIVICQYYKTILYINSSCLLITNSICMLKFLIMRTLYLVGTPIGNLADITYRAVSILSEVSLIAAEDTRNTRVLLKHYDIKTPCVSFHEYSDQSKIDYLLEKLDSGDVALVTDAGMPCISDPGYELVTAAVNKGINVAVIPGPSASVSAIALSGISAEHFTFLGFLPRKAKERNELLENVKGYHHPIVIYEAPHRIIKTLHDIMTVLGNRKISVARELTKVHEECYRGTVSSAIDYFSDPKGEFTVVIDGALTDGDACEDNADEFIEKYIKTGKTFKESLPLLSETGLDRRELYRRWLEIKKELEK